ncbi:hypothetical protein HDU76_010541, partial [Blyttiomyces sp. JEL0837]
FPSPNGNPAAAGTPLQLFPYKDGQNQFYKLVPTDEYRDDNYYTIVNLQTGYCVDALNRGTTNGISIVSMMSNRCLNDYGGGRGAGDKIALWDCNTDPANSPSIVWNIDDAAIGKFWSQIKSYNNLVLDFPKTGRNSPSPAGTQLQLYSSNNGPNQQFRFVPTSDGYFNVINQETGYCIDVLNNKVDHGSPVGLFTCNGQDNQKWSVVSLQIYSGSGALTNSDHIIIYDCAANDLSSQWEIAFNAFPNKNLVTNGGNSIKNVEVVL